jgi:hypothetical protein
MNQENAKPAAADTADELHNSDQLGGRISPSNNEPRIRLQGVLTTLQVIWSRASSVMAIIGGGLPR